MKRRIVVFAPEARDDLLDLGDWIAERAGVDVALKYIERLEYYCSGFELAGERGQRRDDIRPGLRFVGFERRVAIAFTVTDELNALPACRSLGVLRRAVPQCAVWKEPLQPARLAA